MSLGSIWQRKKLDEIERQRNSVCVVFADTNKRRALCSMTYEEARGVMPVLSQLVTQAKEKTTCTNCAQRIDDYLALWEDDKPEISITRSVPHVPMRKL